MLKEFWEAKKHLIQLVGILTGIGALFLSINAPEDIEARQALINIQFVWLLVITFSVIVLFWHFFMLSADWEMSLLKQKDVNFVNTISYLITAIAIFLIFNLWTYLINLYSKSFLHFLLTAQLAVISILGALFFYFWRKIVIKIPEEPKWKRIFFSLFCWILMSLSFGVVIQLLSNSTDFSLSKALLISLLILCLLLLYGWRDSDLRKINPHTSKPTQ